MQRILVGTDGSVSGQVAVRWAAELANATGAELAVASAWEPPSPGAPAELVEAQRAGAWRRLDEEWCSPARDVGIHCEPLLLDGDPRRELLVTADERDAQLVVVGARGTGSYPHALHLGSVAHHLIHHTERPFAVIPASAGPGQPLRIVVGVDGSTGSAHAIDWCADVAAALGTEVLAVHAGLPIAEWVPRSDPISWHQLALKDCATWAVPLRDAGIPTRTFVVEHQPVTALIETAIRERAGLIVVGTRGRSRFTGLRLGSTALKVLHHSGLPVVLVP